SEQRSADHAECRVRCQQIGGQTNRANCLLAAKDNSKHDIKNQREGKRGDYVSRLAQGFQKLILGLCAIHTKQAANGILRNGCGAHAVISCACGLSLSTIFRKASSSVLL